uniref:Sulfhydryl oxidase n=1 Tax=Kalanchoe fedtschenkoi TaxID=63787 RepID=A0A7N0TMJ4_KALFE
MSSDDVNPLQGVFQTFERFSRCVQTRLSQFVGQADRSKHAKGKPGISASLAAMEIPASDIVIKKQSAGPVTKEELGRATWTFLHTLAAQYPEHPTRQQKKDVKELMAILSRMYPCKECADHFKEILRASPVQAGSQSELSQWMCYAHNVVNRSLGKLTFPCERVDARWGKLDCEQRACDLQGTTLDFPPRIP